MTLMFIIHRIWHRRQMLLLGLTLWLVISPCYASSVTSHESYRLGANDLVHIQVYGNDDLNVERKIDGDGNIHYPLLGVLSVAGKTVRELQEDLTARLAGGYVRMPKVTVYVVKYRNFYVSGEVKSAGGYAYEEGMTVHKAISMAGGPTLKAEQGSIKLTRVAGGMAETKVATPEMAVLPDDIIVVETENDKFYASGEVKNPSGYPYKEGLTVHQAIAMAGGLTEKAERERFQVLRQLNGHEEKVAVGLDSLVLPDDIIVIAEGQRIFVSGEVKIPGRYLYEKGMTVHKAVSLAGGWTEKADKTEVKVTRSNSTVVEMTVLEVDMPVMAEDVIIVAQAKRFYVNGEVKRSGDFPYEKGLTVHKAVTMAGGFTDKAAKSSTKVLRIVGGKEHTIEVSLDALVLPEDIIVVPQRFF